jgi:hypothetical protein
MYTAMVAYRMQIFGVETNAHLIHITLDLSYSLFAIAALRR